MLGTQLEEALIEGSPAQEESQSEQSDFCASLLGKVALVGHDDFHRCRGSVGAVVVVARWRVVTEAGENVRFSSCVWEVNTHGLSGRIYLRGTFERRLDGRRLDGRYLGGLHVHGNWRYLWTRQGSPTPVQTAFMQLCPC